MNPVWPVVVGASLSGLALGSYAVTAAIRYARAEPSATGRSHCDQCGVTLPFARTVPILSYLWRRGRCAVCGASIDPLHLAGEISGGIAIGAAALVGDPVRSVLLAILGLVMLASATIDAKVQRLPDVLSFVILLMCLALTALRGGRSGLQVGLATAAITFAILWCVAQIALKSRGEIGLGLGDVKLLTALAIWLGLATPWVVAGAALIALATVAIIRPAGGKLAFGPFIVIAGWLTGMGGELGLWPTTV